MMELRHLRYFLTVAEELHFGRAAQRLGIAQPPLSIQIRNLERELGVELLRRTKRHVELTAAGRLFFDEAQAIVARADGAVSLARRVQSGEVGRLNVAVAPLAVFTVLPGILRQFRARFPGVEVTLREAVGGDLVWAMEQGEIDAGLLIANFDSRVLEMRTLLSVPLRAMVPASHRLAGAATIRLSDLAQDPFIVFPRGAGSGFRQTIIDACSTDGFVPRIGHEVNQVATLLMMVAAGYGVSLVPAALVDPFPGLLRAVGLQRTSVVSIALRPRRLIHLCAAWRPEKDAPALQAFLEIAGVKGGRGRPAGSL